MITKFDKDYSESSECFFCLFSLPLKMTFAASKAKSQGPFTVLAHFKIPVRVRLFPLKRNARVNQCHFSGKAKWPTSLYCEFCENDENK